MSDMPKSTVSPEYDNAKRLIMQEYDRLKYERLKKENQRLRAIIDTLTAKAPATASLAVFLCSKCRESVDTVYDVGSGANIEQLCVNCVQKGAGDAT